MSAVLSVRDARVSFKTAKGPLHALDGVSLDLAPGETLAVVGESGSGKTTLARAVLGLQSLSGGEVELAGTLVRGVPPGMAAKVGMVWQDPFASLDPRWKIGALLQEPLRLAGRSRDVGEMLREVGLDPAMAGRYPHQLSGGQRQRAAIARALALRPPLVICDEPTAALDLSIQAQILNLLRDLQGSLGCSILYISHDLMTVRFLAHRVAVMYLGRIVEVGPTKELFDHPMHPYTKALLESAPSLEHLGRLPDRAIGEIPDPTTRFAGCRFAGRCPRAVERCTQAEPSWTVKDLRKAACIDPFLTS